jgi:hypothetical protein
VFCNQFALLLVSAADYTVHSWYSLGVDEHVTALKIVPLRSNSGSSSGETSLDYRDFVVVGASTMRGEEHIAHGRVLLEITLAAPFYAIARPAPPPIPSAAPPTSPPSPPSF